MTGRMRSLVWVVVALAGLLGSVQAQQVVAPEAGAENLGWRLGMQAYTFNSQTFFEAVDQNKELGLKVIEAFPGQKLSKDGDVKVDVNMPADAKKKMLDKLKEADVKLVNFGVTGADSPEAWRKLFEFAREMGIETIVSEPAEKDFDLLDKLVEEFQINIAIHNHPKPSPYWSPESVLKVIQGRSKRIGACADTGHFRRSGLDPLESLKKLEGHIISLHFKDLDQDEKAKEAEDREWHDTPWGTGQSDAWALLGELKRQNFRGTFAIEYEYHWNKAMPELAKCVQYFNLVTSALDASSFIEPTEQDFAANTIQEQGGWEFKDGVLESKGKGDVWSRQKFGDFVFDLEFKCAENTNSGVFLRCASIEDWLNTAIEVQIAQQKQSKPAEDCGGLFDVLAPSKDKVKKSGEWNHYTILARGSQIVVVLNGTQVVNADLDKWTEAGKNPDGSKNKFKYAYKDMARVGHLGLQYHGTPISFRNLKVKALSEVQGN